MKRTLLSTILIMGFLALFAQSPGSGSSLNFDGVNDYVNIPNAPSLNPTTTMTVEAWIRADSYGPNPWSNSIVNKEGWASGNQGYAFRCGQNGRLSFIVAGAGVGPWQEVESAPLMSTNTWYHVAGSYDGTTLRVFINGEQVATTPFFGTLGVGNYDVRIGQISYAPGGNRYFDGQIDEVRIWSQALPASTLRTWMCKKINPSHPNYANLGAYWNLDEDTGTTIADSSGNMNSGVLTNGPLWQTSGAHIGNESVFKYGAMIPLGLAHPNGDSLSIDTITGSPNGIHLYRVDDGPNVSTPPTGSNMVDTSRYWGVFAVGGNNPSFNVEYHYTGNPMATGACGVGMAERDNNASTSWTDMGATNNTGSSTLTVSGVDPGEFILSTQTIAVNVTAVGALSFCQGDSVSLLGNSSSTATYQWKLNGVDINGATDSMITVSAAGSYSLEMTDQGCSATSSAVTVTVNPIPSVSFNAVNPICLNATPLLLTTGMPVGGNYTGTGVNTGFFDPMVADTGFHNLTYIYTDVNGCTDSAQQSVQVLSLPTVSLDTFPGLCQDAQAIQLGGGMPTGGTFSGMGVSNNMFDPLISGSGIFQIEYTITGANGCDNSVSESIEVFASPMVNAGPDKTTCPGDSVVIVASGAMTYAWSNGDSTASIQINPLGDSTLTVVGVDANGCAASDDVSINILPAPVADAGLDQTICEGDTAILMASGGTNYLWNNGFTTSAIDVNPADTTSYSVFVTDLSGCTDRDTVWVFVDPLPTAGFNLTYNTGFEINFVNNSTNDNSWFWDFGDGFTDTTQTPTHTYQFTGTFEVMLISTNDCGSDTITAFVETGIESINNDLYAPNISLYPNPTPGHFQISISDLDHKLFSLKIMDIRGRKIWEKKINPVSGEFLETINLESQPEGMYLLEVSSEKYRVMEKIVLQR